MEESKLKFPTEIIELPSKGLVYPEGSPLRTGKVEMKYMTAKEEDILTNQNYIQNGIVIDKLLESLLIGDLDPKDLCTGDRNAIMVSARILGYGKDYEFEYKKENYKVDLSIIENKPFDESLVNPSGYASFILPTSKTPIEFKFLTDKDEEKIEQEIKSLSKFNKATTSEVTTRMKHLIVSIDGDSDKNNIKTFVDNYFLAQDARALRNYVKDISPDVDFSFTTNNGEEATLPIGLNFFWPDL